MDSVLLKPTITMFVLTNTSAGESGTESALGVDKTGDGLTVNVLSVDKETEATFTLSAEDRQKLRDFLNEE